MTTKICQLVENKLLNYINGGFLPHNNSWKFMRNYKYFLKKTFNRSEITYFMMNAYAEKELQMKCFQLAAMHGSLPLHGNCRCMYIDMAAIAIEQNARKTE